MLEAFSLSLDSSACAADFVDHMAGGNIIKRLQKVSEFEVTTPDKQNRLIMSDEVCTLVLSALLLHVTFASCWKQPRRA